MQSRQDRIDRINLWKEAFADDTTGICTTVQDLLWDYAAFRTSAQIVHLSGERQDGGRTLNQMLFNLIREGYWSSLLLGARRLLDKHPLKGPKGVYSIRAVVSDVKASRRWLTRRVYVEELHGAELDNERLHREFLKKIAESDRPVWASREKIRSDAAHTCFDELCGNPPGNRNSDDIIDEAIFTRIEARLSSLDRIADHATTHIAHAGNEESRSIRQPLTGFNIQDARSTLKQLTEVSNLVGVWFANTGIGGLATFQGDQFEGLDQPMVESTDIQNLWQNWQDMSKDISGWTITKDEL
jgi:AbiU2